MTYVPHIRMTMSGRLGTSTGPEIFSMNLCIANRNGTSLPQGALDLDANDVVWTDMADDAVAWFSAASTGIHSDATLMLVKFAYLDENGHYTRPPIEKPVLQAGGATGTRPANQVARAVTLHTTADLGRVKGRFYAPLATGVVSQDGRWTDAVVNAFESSDKTFIDNLNNQPGLDVLDLAVHVASQGRRNKDGSVRLAPGNHPVTSVSVGRVPDTQRRRRNKLLEARTPIAVA